MCLPVLEAERTVEGVFEKKPSRRWLLDALLEAEAQI
jgi:hypothetical protein